jgi:hypothetical protein
MSGYGRGRRQARVRYWGFSIAGGIAGLLVALPLGLPPDSSCPAPGEGQVFCQLEGGVIRPLTLIVLGLIAGHVLARLCTEVLPALVARLRAGERLRVRSARLPETTTDPLLLAAGWAHVGDEVARPEQRQRARIAWLAASTRPPAVAGPAGALPVVAVATSTPAAAAPPVDRPVRAVCPSCLIWHPLEQVADGCPQCGTACVVPPRVAQPTREQVPAPAGVA